MDFGYCGGGFWLLSCVIESFGALLGDLWLLVVTLVYFSGCLGFVSC